MALRCFRICICFVLLLASLSAPVLGADLTGTWKFSVDLDTGEHGDPVFVLKQTNDQLTGTYQGPFGSQKVAGNVKGDTAMLEVAASGAGQTLKLSYTAKLESPDKMSGTITRNVNGESTPGKFSATRAK